MEDLLDLGDRAGNPAFSRRRPLRKTLAACLKPRITDCPVLPRLSLCRHSVGLLCVLEQDAQDLDLDLALAVPEGLEVLGREADLLEEQADGRGHDRLVRRSATEGDLVDPVPVGPLLALAHSRAPCGARSRPSRPSSNALAWLSRARSARMAASIGGSPGSYERWPARTSISSSPTEMTGARRPMSSGVRLWRWPRSPRRNLPRPLPRMPASTSIAWSDLPVPSTMSRSQVRNWSVLACRASASSIAGRWTLLRRPTLRAFFLLSATRRLLFVSASTTVSYTH